MYIHLFNKYNYPHYTHAYPCASKIPAPSPQHLLEMDQRISHVQSICEIHIQADCRTHCLVHSTS